MNINDAIDLVDDWGDDPAQFEDEGVDAPTAKTLRYTMRCLQYLRLQGVRTVTMTRDPNGGIIIENTDGVRITIEAQ